MPVLLFCLNFKCLVTSSTQSFRNVWSYTPPLNRYCLFSNFDCLVFCWVFLLFLIKGTEIINKKVEWNAFEYEKNGVIYVVYYNCLLIYEWECMCEIKMLKHRKNQPFSFLSLKANLFCIKIEIKYCAQCEDFKRDTYKRDQPHFEYLM